MRRKAARLLVFLLGGSKRLEDNKPRAAPPLYRNSAQCRAVQLMIL